MIGHADLLWLGLVLALLPRRHLVVQLEVLGPRGREECAFDASCDADTFVPGADARLVQPLRGDRLPLSAESVQLHVYPWDLCGELVSLERLLR